MRLRLIQNNQLPSRDQPIPGQIEFEDIRFILQIEVMAAQRLRQGRFSALTRPNHGDGRVAPKILLQPRSDRSRLHGLQYTI